MNLTVQDVQAYDYARTIFTSYGRYLERNNIKEDTLDNYDDFIGVYDYDKNEIIEEKEDIDNSRDLIDEMLCWIQNHYEDYGEEYQMYLTDESNHDIYFYNIDELLDILKLKFSELDDSLKDISYIEQYKEYKFKINNKEYHLGEL